MGRTPFRQAAAPHPRGLFLACSLLEKLNRADNRLVHGYQPLAAELTCACSLMQRATAEDDWRLAGTSRPRRYYEQLIARHSTAHDLSVAMESLRAARRAGSSIGSARWRVSDATVAALMSALNTQSALNGTTVDAADAADAARSSAVAALGAAGLQLDQKMEE